MAKRHPVPEFRGILSEALDAYDSGNLEYDAFVNILRGNMHLLHRRPYARQAPFKHAEPTPDQIAVVKNIGRANPDMSYTEIVKMCDTRHGFHINTGRISEIFNPPERV